MAYPGSLDTFTNPGPADALDDPPHHLLHSSVNDAVAAVQAKLGVDNSQDASSIDYLLKSTSSLNPGHRHTAGSITGLATVATSGSYNDLLNKPTLLQGPKGDAGATGPQGVAGPNSVSATTSTALTGYLKGNGTGVSSQATPIPYADTGLPALGSAYQVLRVNAGGTALEYAAIPAATPGGSSGQVQFNSGGAFGGTNASYSASTGVTTWRNAGGAGGATVTAAAEFSNPAGTDRGERFGTGAAAGDLGVAVGNSASAGAGGVALGYGCAVNSFGIAIGYNVAGGNGRVVIGPDHNAAGGALGVLVGGGFTTTGYYQLGYGLNRGALPAVNFAGWFGVCIDASTGYQHRLFGKSSAAGRDMHVTSCEWADPADGTRKSRARHGVFDAASDIAFREYLRAESDGAQPLLGFYGATASARPTVTGAKGGNAALASLASALATLGLITDSTT